MITSAIKCTKKKRTKHQTDRTLEQMVKAKLYRQIHTQKHTHTHTDQVSVFLSLVFFPLLTSFLFMSPTP